MFDYDAYDAILHHVFEETHGDAWFKPSEDNAHAGVCLRIEPGSFRVFPFENELLLPFEAAVRALNPAIAVKVRSATVHAVLSSVAEDETALYIDFNTRIQVLDSIDYLPHADKEQCAAFIRDERILVVWTDNLDHIIPMCKEFRDKLIKLVWRTRAALKPRTSILTLGSVETTLTTPVSCLDSPLLEKSELTEKSESPEKAKRHRGCLSFLGWRSTRDEAKSRVVEEGDFERRPVVLLAPIYGGLSAGLSIIYVGNGANILIQEYMLTGSYARFALLATAPLLFCVSLFFSYTVINSLSFVIGPVAQYHQNSRFYSAIKPNVNTAVDLRLPHVTIQMPVYKESLKETITPTVESLKRAMQTYSRQGGTSNIFINDDGLQLLNEEERSARLEFYANHGIGFVARPRHDDEDGGFKRAGRFKKASNMNYGLALSLKFEICLTRLEAEQERKVGDAQDGEQQDVVGSYFPEEDRLEERALQMAVEETFAESGNLFRPWAANARSIRVGDIILIVDSDTIVPEDCFRDAARELAECPDVGIIQHESDVMQVAHHYFENGIAHFTRKVNRSISMACANGEVAPFVGHNAFLRWSALQDAAFVDPADGKKKIWSESNVSEDFDMALRLQLKGYIIRWASYAGGGFKEGVSLTCDDELNRWQKYAYGCNELIFNPLIEWWKKGPINYQLRTFVWSNAPLHYKLSMMSYMFSYYAIACSSLISLMNYLLLGLAYNVDGFYMHSFEIWMACLVVFPLAGNIVGFTILDYRLGTRGLLEALVGNFTWIPFFTVFFGGLSIHLSQALLAHLFSYNITWGATKKEVERSNFFLEVPKILRRFWLSFILAFLFVGAMIVMCMPFIPLGWRIPADWALMIPLGTMSLFHILYPILLNPWLMIFSY